MTAFRCARCGNAGRLRGVFNDDGLALPEVVLADCHLCEETAPAPSPALDLHRPGLVPVAVQKPRAGQARDRKPSQA